MIINTLCDTIHTWFFLGVLDGDSDGVAGSGSLVELAFKLEGVVSSTLVCWWRYLSMARFFCNDESQRTFFFPSPKREKGSGSRAARAGEASVETVDGAGFSWVCRAACLAPLWPC